MSFSPVQPLKAELPISVTPAGRVMLVSPVQPLKAELSIWVSRRKGYARQPRAAAKSRAFDLGKPRRKGYLGNFYTVFKGVTCNVFYIGRNFNFPFGSFFTRFDIMVPAPIFSNGKNIIGFKGYRNSLVCFYRVYLNVAVFRVGIDVFPL